MHSCKQMKKVLFICSQPCFDWRGSPIRVGFNLLALTKNGFQVTFLTLPYGRRRQFENVRIIRTFALPFIKSIPIGPSIPKLLYDCLHFFYGAKELLRDKDIGFIHGVEDSGIPALALAALFRKKLIFEKHSDPASHRQKNKGLKNLVLDIYQWVESLIIRRSDLVIGTGDELVNQAREVEPLVSAYAIPDIPSSLAESKESEVKQLRRSLGVGERQVLTCYVGSFAVYQGIDLLFQSIPLAVKKNRNIIFMIIGGRKEEIEERKAFLREHCCLDNVIFTGFVDPDQLPTYLCAADILLSPRISGRNSPLKVLDYLKAKRAIVATDIEANNQILTTDTAMLVDPVPEELAEAVYKLSVDRNLRERLAAEGEKLIKGRYNFRYFSDTLGKAYLGICLSENRPQGRG